MYLFFSFYKYCAGYSQREREYSSCLLEFTFYLGNNHRNIMLLGFFPTVFFFTINSFLHDCFCLSHHFLSLECPETWSNFPGGSGGKASAYNARDLGSIPGSGRSPGEGNGNPLQYSCLENSTGLSSGSRIYITVLGFCSELQTGNKSLLIIISTWKSNGYLTCHLCEGLKKMPTSDLTHLQSRVETPFPWKWTDLVSHF